MENRIFALIASFIAMVFVVFSYFTTKKERFLFFQSLCIVFLIISYFFTVQFFAMVGLAIGLLRAVVYFFYEKRGRMAPLWIPIGLCLMTTVSYLVVNIGILKDASVADIVLLLSLYGYIFIFRVRNLTLVRYLMLLPTVLSVLFNVWTNAALFATLSYVFEFSANAASILKYNVLAKRKEKKKKALP